MRRRLLGFGRAWEPGVDWQANVRNEHERSPFAQAIVSRKWGCGPPEILVEEATDGDFVGKRECVLPRHDPQGLARALEPLLVHSKVVLLVDPYFLEDSQYASRSRWTTSVCALLRAAGQAGRAPRCEIHTKRGPQADTFSNFRSTCCELVLPQLPAGLPLDVYRWEQLRFGDGSRGDRLHPRYVLTDIGGVRIEGGLDTGPVGETTDVSLLSDELWQKRWEQYRSFREVSPRSRWAFEPADGVDERGRPIHVTLSSP